MSRWSMVAAWVAVAGCSSGQPVVAPVLPDSTAPGAERDLVLDRAALDSASQSLDDGEFGTSAVLADSLWRAWLGADALDPESASDLVDLLDAVGEEDRAAHLLLRAPFELDGGERKRLRRLSEGLSIAELQELLDDTEGRTEARSIVAAELAVALAVADHEERARMEAEFVLSGSPDGPERNKAEDVLEGKVAAISAPVRVGVVLPTSGRFAGVGEQLMEGIRLAVERHGADADNPPVELVVVDDSSSLQRGIEAVERLEKMGVVAVLGPLRTEALRSAASRRHDEDLFLLSPTAGSGQGEELNAYTLWDRESRETDVATTLVAWMMDEMGLRSFGVLYPRGWSPAALQALREQVELSGGGVLAAEEYATDSTTFGTPVAALAAAEPEAVVVFSDRPRTVLQIAPQLVYYGLRRWVTGGDANWSDPEVVRRLDSSYADHRLVATYVDRISADTPWQRFKSIYEAQYRKKMPDNMFAPLGYDAMELILAGVPEAEASRRGSIGRGVRRAAHEGATGTLAVDLATGRLRRAVFVRVILAGELRVPDAVEMRQWAQEQAELEEFLRALEEEKEQENAEGEG